MANLGMDPTVASAAPTGVSYRFAKATSVGTLVFPFVEGRDARGVIGAPVSFALLALPVTALGAEGKVRRPAYGLPLFGAGNLSGGSTATTVGTNAATATGPTTGQQWPRGVKVG